MKSMFFSEVFFPLCLVLDSIHNYIQIINPPIINVKKEMEVHKTLLDTLKIGVRPNDCFVSIQNPITL